MPTIYLGKIKIEKLQDKYQRTYFLITNTRPSKHEKYFCFQTELKDSWNKLMKDWNHFEELELEYEIGREKKKRIVTNIIRTKKFSKQHNRRKYKIVAVDFLTNEANEQVIKFTLNSWVQYCDGREKFIHCLNAYPFNTYQVGNGVEINQDLLSYKLDVMGDATTVRKLGVFGTEYRDEVISQWDNEYKDEVAEYLAEQGEVSSNRDKNELVVIGKLPSAVRGYELNNENYELTELAELKREVNYWKEEYKKIKQERDKLQVEKRELICQIEASAKQVPQGNLIDLLL